MWLLVSFDLPTATKKDRRDYTLFRKFLLKDGFTMLQFSVYVRQCLSKESRNVHLKRVFFNLPEKGEVINFTITDKQFGMIEFYQKGLKQKKPPLHVPEQLELF